MRSQEVSTYASASVKFHQCIEYCLEPLCRGLKDYTVQLPVDDVVNTVGGSARLVADLGTAATNVDPREG